MSYRPRHKRRDWTWLLAVSLLAMAVLWIAGVTLIVGVLWWELTNPLMAVLWWAAVGLTVPTVLMGRWNDY